MERDEKKTAYYWEQGAIRGDDGARVALGYLEQNFGNIDRALRHHMIAVTYGHQNSLTVIQKLYSNGQATKDDYTKALRAYQDYLNDVKSPQRDEAAAFSELYKYLE